MVTTDPAAELQRGLLDAHAQAAERWPGVVIEAERFAAFVTARCTNVADARGLAMVRCDQLYLTCACAAGDPVALAAFDRTHGKVIASALARMAAAVTDPDEVKQRVWERLFVGDAETPPRIAEYTGRGELSGWVRAVTVRTALNYRRAHAREAPSDDVEELMMLLPAAGSDPELATLLERYRADVGAALAEAIDSLSDIHRAVLRYHYAERLNIEQIGAIFGVHKTTAFRRLEQARAELIDAARVGLKRRLGVDDAGLMSIVRVVSSHLDLTLSGFFKDRA
ncbi:MAG: polymerase, sigma-24 subunit, subfamily [Deltaproteobacteria bacterium]|nr:polymerase, sigma-24 subunit, subfamily [Deltaproteobacteria bacterium]